MSTNEKRGQAGHQDNSEKGHDPETLSKLEGKRAHITASVATVYHRARTWMEKEKSVNSGGGDGPNGKTSGTPDWWRKQTAPPDSRGESLVKPKGNPIGHGVTYSSTGGS